MHCVHALRACTTDYGIFERNRNSLLHPCNNTRAIYIGYTMKPRGLRDLDARGNLFKHPRAKRKGVYGFQGDLNPVGPEGFIV